MGEILHCNVRGLKTISTRNSKVDIIKTFLESNKAIFINLQETRLENQNQIPNQFTDFGNLYNIIFSGSGVLDQGSGILVFVRKTEEILETSELMQGRLVHIKTRNLVTSEVLNFFSLYCKSNATRVIAQELITKIKNKIEEGSLENLVICGDYNFVTSTNDRNSNKYTQSDLIYKDIWTNFEIEHNLLDTFRNLYPRRRLYTFSQAGGNSKSRIDRVYFSNELIGRVQNMSFNSYEPFDHKMVILKLKNKIDTGPGIWIFNNKLLEDQYFVQEAHRIVGLYANSVNFPNKKLAWDFLKMDLANFAKDYSKVKAREKRESLKIAINKLEVLESLPKENIDLHVEQEISRLKKIEWSFNQDKIDGYLIRSRFPHIEEGEGNISFFARLEKRKGEENCIFTLENSEGEIQEGTENIKQIVFDFYSKLYTKEEENEASQEILLGRVNASITDEERLFMDQQLSSQEIRNALMKMQKGKTPGTDGITNELLSYFWDGLADFYDEVIREIYETGELTNSQKKGIIKITYKKNGRQYIKNYRPITLLNTDLKIITKSLAIRLAKVLQNLINNSQKCVKGRKISENIHLVQDLIDAVLKKNLNAAFIMVDQEKAFDRISHSFLMKTLRRYGFGQTFIRWVEIIYKGATSRIKVNGFLTEIINIERGVRQGCALSALLYVLCSEVLNTNIRVNQNIVGIRLNQDGIEYKETSFADDLGTFVSTEESMNELFRLFHTYEQATNAKMNKEKTEAMWLGNWKERIDRPLGLNWTSGEVKFLGVYIGNERSGASLRTFSEIKEKVKNKLSYWNSKFISKKGKTKVLNTFVLSKLWYALEIHDIPNFLLKEFNDLIKSFIWKGYPQRKLTVLSLPYVNGGLALQSIESKVETLRLKWLNDLWNKEHLYKEKEIVNYLIGEIDKIKGIRILLHNKHIVNHIFNSFYKNAYTIWKKKNISFKPKSIESIKNDWIYDNILLKDDDGRIFKPPGYYNDETLPNYVPTIFANLPVQIPLGSMRGQFRRQIPKINRAFFRLIFSFKDYDEFFLPGNKPLSDDFKSIYTQISLVNITANPIWERKWVSEAGFEEVVFNWRDIWKSVHNKIINYKIQSSIWEMIHRNYICGYSLRQMNFSDGICKLCNQQEEERIHIFMKCIIIEQVYHHFSNILVRIVNRVITNVEKAFGIYEEVTNNISLRNYITYTIRHIVYRNRNINLTQGQDAVVTLIGKIKNFLKKDLTEKFHNHKMQNKMELFRSTFLIANIVGSIQNGELTFHF